MKILAKNKSENFSYGISIRHPYQVGYAKKLDEIFIYWIVDDIIHCLGESGKYQVAFVDHINAETFERLGDL